MPIGPAHPFEPSGGFGLTVLAITASWPISAQLGAAAAPATGALLLAAAALGRLDPIGRVGGRMAWAERIFSVVALLVAAWLFVGIVMADRGQDTDSIVECYGYDSYATCYLN